LRHSPRDVCSRGNCKIQSRTLNATSKYLKSCSASQASRKAKPLKTVQTIMGSRFGSFPERVAYEKLLPQLYSRYPGDLFYPSQSRQIMARSRKCCRPVSW